MPRMALGSALILAAALRTLVLPFDNLSASPDTDWYRGALAETIASHLKAAGEDVVSVESVHRELAERNVEPGDPMTRGLLVELAWVLEADRIILGGFDTIDRQLNVTADVRDAEGKLIAVLDDFGEINQSRALMNRFARNVFRIHGSAVPAELDRVAARRQALRFDALKALSNAWLEPDPEKRRQFVQQAVSNDPNFVEARLWVAELLLDDHELEGSISRRMIGLLGAIPSEEPFYPYAYFGMGVAYLVEDELSEAEKIFQHLGSRYRQEHREPRRVAGAAVWNNLGVIRMRQGNLEGAVEAFQQAVALDPEDPTCLFNLGFGFWRAGKGSAAYEQLRELTRLNPLDAEAFWLLEAASKSQAMASEAELSGATARTLAPHLAERDAATVSGLERVMLRWSREASALVPPWFDPQKDYLDETSRLGMAMAFVEAGNPQRGIQLLQRELYHEPGSMVARLRLATLYREQGELELAAGELQVALWHEPRCSIHIELASVYEELGQLEASTEQLGLALELEPENADALALQERISAAAPR